MENSLIKYLGVTLFALFLIYFVLHLANSQRRLVEGLTNNDSDDSNAGADSEKIAENIKDMSTKVIDSMLLDKYRKNYEDIVINMEELCNAVILKTIVSGKMDINQDTGDGSTESKKTLAKLALVNDLEKLKASLNSTMKFLDSQ